jgi:hypothetical protein
VVTPSCPSSSGRSSETLTEHLAPLAEEFERELVDVIEACRARGEVYLEAINQAGLGACEEEREESKDCKARL